MFEEIGRREFRKEKQMRGNRQTYEGKRERVEGDDLYFI
jgi:hypothetical protein